MQSFNDRRSSPSQHGYRTLGSRSLMIAFIVVACGVGVIVYGLSSDRGQLAVLAAQAAALSLIADIFVSHLLPGYTAPRLLIATYALQLATLAAIAAMQLPLSPPYHPFDVNAADAPFRAVAPMLIVPVTTVVVACAWRFLCPSADAP